jgi:thiamine-monophosphate kinase
LSDGFIEYRGNGREARLFAATAGDDYALLAALPAGLDPSTLSLPDGTTMARVGSLVAGGPRIAVVSGGHSIELPETLGFEHQSDQYRPGSGPPVADRD